MTITAGRVAGKKAIVTGAARGIGAAVAWMLARHGAQVVLTDVDEEPAAKLAEAINAEIGAGTARAYRHDVSDEASWPELIGAATDAMDGFSVLVNNAGIARLGSVEELSCEDWRKNMSINVDSVFFGCKHAIRVMRRYAPGSIVNISSIAGLIAAHNLAGYNASKAAVWMLTKSIALHCAREQIDIRCNSIHPAFIRTRILDSLFDGAEANEKKLQKLARQIPLGRLGEPQDVAFAVLYLASDESRFMTGAEIKLDGGISAM